MEFTHLHVHTEYSLLDGSNKIKEYVARVKELGMDSAAITDHGVMYGVIDFYRAARAEGINPILGCEVYVAPGSRFDREAGSGEDRYYHLVLLAENNQGYANLMKIVSKGFTEGFYYKPRVDLAVLKEYHEGIIALSACLAGEVARYLQRGMYEDAKAAALRYQDIFGKGNFFLELQDHGIPAQRLVNQELLRMHEETGIDLVVTNDVHYTRAEDADPHDILLCLQTNKKLADEDRMRYEGGQYYVKSPEEMAELFPYALEALENTHKIAQRCHVEIEFGVTKLPRFDVPDGLTSWEYLNKLCFEGLEERYQPVTEELKARLNYELSTIKNMGYVDYFLIVWDFIKYARDHDIMVGPGRGSAAGSLVAYTLGITQLDPIRYDLLFERFLNPERVSMPDIDVDFCFERRQEVIEYVRRKYGDDCVVQIVTFGTLAARGVIRDVGRVLDMPYAQVDSIAKMIGTGRSDGVFQLESAGMKNFMKELKPQSLEDVIAGISLYRPGPMDFIPQYIRGKNRPDTIRYDCPQLEPILKPTYGCIVYQEQVMQIVRNLAGYTLGRSDLVRRAMSKKKASVMEKERQNFVYGNEAEGVPGCIANGIDEATANKIYDEMIDFAKYAFNKSHAAAYAVVSYQTAYLKYYYPVEFMAALMTSVIDFPNKVAEYILVCRQMGIKILPPDVNCGMYGFSVDNGAIRYGLSAIKSVGRPVIESLVKERDENGQYRSLKDFMERNSPQMNKRAVENFIKAGALDCLDGNRRQKMLVYQKISDSISQDKKNSLAGQMSLFDLVSEEDKKEFEIRMPDVEEFGKEELLGYEKEVLGIYLSGHPLENYRGMMEKTISAKTSDFQQDEETNLPKVMDGQKVIIGGMITDKTIKYTKNNKVMAFLTVEDLVGTVEVVVFPRDYEKSQQFLNEEGRVFIQGRVSAEDDRASKLILEKIRPFDNMPREIWIQFDNKESYTQQSQELLADLRRSPGDSAVVIYLKDVKAIKKLPVGYHAQIQDSWLNYMYEKYGKTNVKVVERGLKNL